MQANQEKLYLHGLNLLPQLGPARLLKLVKLFGSFQKTFKASAKEFQALGLEPEVAQAIASHCAKVNLTEEAEKLAQADIEILTYQDGNYPKLLLEIPKFPPILYVRGKMAEPEELCVAVVGTRKITNYGRSVIPDLVTPLVDRGVTIVSGMAFGVDSEAHKIAITKHKRTIAVLGGGLDDKSLYPKHHQLLAQEILDNGGALLSEYPIGTPNFKQNFVARNRIISGLSAATIIIECDIDSGSLITAQHALDQNRQVFAVPGPIYAEMSKGPNNLIKMGAKAITEASDVLEDLNLQKLPEEQSNQKLFGDNVAETKLLEIISREPLNVNEIIKLSGLEASEATSTLTMLEMKGRVRNLGAQQYILSR